MDGWLRDLRFSVRQLRRRPGFAVVATLTLALGIGATTAVFNAAEVALYEPLSFGNGDRLVRVYRVPEAGTPHISLRPATYQAVVRRGRFFDRIVAQRFTTFVHPTEAGPEYLVGIAVTAGWAETLGVQPYLGRTFTPDEEALGDASGVVLLGYGTWQRELGGAADAIGRTIILDGHARTVVGVMKPGMNYPYGADLWVPMRVDDAQRGPWSFNVQARLRPGVTLEAAREDLRAVTRETVTAGDAPALQGEGMTLTALRTRDVLAGGKERTTLALLGAVAFLLLVVCANLANLLVARGLARGREFAVRASLGASRGRLTRQLLTESLLLGGVGSFLGIFLARLGTGLAEPLLPPGLADVQGGLAMNGAVLAFAVGVSLLCTLLFGLVPAVRLSRVWPGSGLLRTRDGGSHSRQLGRSLVVTEVALGIVLLTGTGLIVRDLQRLSSVDLGYDPAGLLTFSVSLSQDAYTAPSARMELVSQAVARLDALPGVTASGVTTTFPSDQGNSLAQVEIEGREAVPGQQLLVNHRLVTPGFLRAMGVPLLAGRAFTQADGPDAPPVAVVSAAMARRFWPDQSPLGQRVRSVGGTWMTVVGVVADVRQFWDVNETWYLPYMQHAADRDASSETFTLRSPPGRMPPASAIRSTMANVAPALPVVDLVSATELHAQSLTRQRQAAGLSTAFAAFGLLLAAMGLYGSMSYAVTRRRREFGVRMALGGNGGRILRNVVGEGLRLVGLGSAIGLLGSLGVGRLLSRALETTSGFDPASAAIALLALTVTGVCAAVIPARRAARVDPMEALREE